MHIWPVHVPWWGGILRRMPSLAPPREGAAHTPGFLVMSTTREEQCLSWEVHAAARTTELCAKLDKAPERGVPAVAMKPSQVLVKGYREAAAAMKTAMLKYVERLAGLKETTAMLQAVCTEGERPVVTLTAASCMRQDERIGSTHAVMPEQGIFKLMLSRRCPVAAGLKATQTYVLRAHTGSWICVPLRNCIPEPLSVQHLTLAAVRHQRAHPSQSCSFSCLLAHIPCSREASLSLQVHKHASIGWYLGCEADQPPSVERDVHALRTQAGAAALRVVDKFTITNLYPRSGLFSNKCLVDYKNPQGQVTLGWGACCASKHKPLPSSLLITLLTPNDHTSHSPPCQARASPTWTGGLTLRRKGLWRRLSHWS